MRANNADVGGVEDYGGWCWFGITGES